MTLCIFASGFVKSKLWFEDPVIKFMEMIKYRSCVKNIVYNGNINGLISTIYTESLKHKIPITQNSISYDINCDFYIALPGGLGTIYQMTRVIYGGNPILIYNIDGFYNNFIDYLEEIQAFEMIDSELIKNVKIVSTLAEIEEWLKK